jgi:hypothetical protein
MAVEDGAQWSCYKHIITAITLLVSTSAARNGIYKREVPCAYDKKQQDSQLAVKR